MNKKTLMFTSLAALALPLMAGCEKKVVTEAVGKERTSEILLNLVEMGKNLTTVKESTSQYQYNEQYGDVTISYEMNKKIHDNHVAISTGKAHYETLIADEEWNVVEQTFRKGSKAYTLHDETDSGEATFSYKKTRAGSQLNDLLYSGVDKEFIGELREANESENESFKAIKKGSEYNFKLEEKTNLANGNVLSIKYEVVCKEVKGTFQLASFTNFQQLKNNFGDKLIEINNNYKYGYASQGNYDGTFLNENDYAEWFPDIEVEEINVANQLSDTEISAVIKTTEATTATATSTHVVETIQFNAGSSAGYTIVNEENLRHYTGEAYGASGLVYGTGVETAIETASKQELYALNYTKQEGNYEFTVNGTKEWHKYTLQDYEDTTVEDSVRAYSAKVTAETAVDLRDSMVQAYSSVIGKNYNNARYAATRDEKGNTTVYINLAFSQEDEEEPGVRQHLIAVYDKDNTPISIDYTEIAYYESNLSDVPYYVFNQKVEFHYGETFEDITPLNVADYLQTA